MSNYYKSNTSPTGRILNPKGFIGLSEFQDADVEGKRKLANEYLADLRNAFLNSDEFADKNEALSSWKEDAKYVWDNVDSGWGERAVEAGKGLVRSVAYGTMAVPAVVAHGGASLGSRIASTLSGDEADRLYNQRQIDDALPSGAIFNEKISQIGTRIGDAFKTDNSRHDDFDVFMNASERYAIDKTEENLRLLNDAERKLLQSSADFNREDVKNYAHRSISQNNDVKNLLSLYLATNDPELRSEIKKHYILSLSDEGSQNRIERQKKRQLDYWGEDSVVGNEMATRLEYANPLDMAGTALGVGLAWKGAKAVVGGAKAAKTASFASRLGKGTKEFAKGVIAEAGTEIADTLVENPAATNKQLYEAGRSAFDQEALTFGIGTGVRAVQNRNRKEIQEQVDKIGALGDISGAGATSGAETASTETTSGGTTSGGESGTLTGSTTSTIGGKTTVETHTADDIVGATEAPTVPEGTPLGSIFWANVGGVDSAPVRLLFRNVDGVAVPLSKKEIEALSDEEVVAIYDAETGGDVSISDEQIEKVNEAAGTTEPTTETTPVETTPVETTPVETTPVETETDVAPVESGTGEVVEKETAFTEPVEVYEWDNDSGDYVERAQADSHAYEDSRRNTIKRATLTPEELLEEFNRERAKQAELNGRTYPGYAKERIEQTKANGKRGLDNLNKGEDSELYIRKSKNGFSICKGRKILKKFKSEQELETFLNQWALVAFEAHQRRSKLWLAVYNNDQKAIEKAVNSLTEDVYFDGIKLATGMPLDEAKSWVNQYASDMETDNYYIAEKREALDKREFDSDAKFIDWLLVYDRFFAKAFKDAEKTILDAIDYGWTTLSDKQKKSIGKDAGKAFVAEELNKWIATQLPKLKQRYGVKIKGETKAPKVDKNGQYELSFDAKKLNPSNKNANTTKTPVDANAKTSASAERAYRIIMDKAKDILKKLKRVVNVSDELLPDTIKRGKDGFLSGVCSQADIRRYIENAFAIPIAKGIRDVGQDVAGVYYNTLNAIRTNKGHHNDVVTVIAHELGHHLEMLLFGYKLNGSRTSVENELASLAASRFGDSYSQTLLAREGWAEFIADILNEKSEIQKKCPITYELLKRALADNPDVSKVLNNVRMMLRIHRNMSPEARAQANVRRRSDDVSKSTIKEKINKVLKNLERSLFDGMVSFEDIAKEMGAQGVAEGEKLLTLARNFRGGHLGRTISSIKIAQCDIDGNVVGKSLLDIVNDNLKTTEEKEKAEIYLAARRIIAYFGRNCEITDSLNEQSRSKFGITYADAKAVYNAATPGMRKFAAEIDVFLRNNLKLLLDGGVITQEVYDKLIKNQGYVPLQRYMELLNDDAGGSTLANKGFTNQSAPLKAFKGSDREIIAVMDSIIKQVYVFREVAEKNRVAGLLVRGFEKGKEFGKYATPAPDKVDGIKANLYQLAEKIVDYNEFDGLRNGRLQRPYTPRERKIEIASVRADLENNPDAHLIAYRQRAMADERNQVVTVVTPRGVAAWQIHDKGLYVALTAMDVQVAKIWSTMIGKAAHWSARLLRGTATAAWTFIVKNLIRDTASAFILTKNGYRPLDGLWFGLFPAFAGRFPTVASKLGMEQRHKDLYNEWQRAGGSMASSSEGGGQYTEEADADLVMGRGRYNGKSLGARLWQGVKDIIAIVEDLTGVGEDAIRIGEYYRAKQKGIKQLQAERKISKARATKIWETEEGADMR